MVSEMTANLDIDIDVSANLDIKAKLRIYNKIG
jgi:hypothetical protein